MNRPNHFSMNVLSHFVAAVQVSSHHSLNNMMHIQIQRKMCGQTYRRCIYITRTWVFWSMVSKLCPPEHTHCPPWASTQDVACLNQDCLTRWGMSGVLQIISNPFCSLLQVPHVTKFCRINGRPQTSPWIQIYGIQIRGRSRPCCLSTLFYPMCQKHTVERITKMQKKCGWASSCTMHKRILVYRSTSFNSSGREFRGTSSYIGRKTVGSQKSVSCNTCMETQGGWREHFLQLSRGPNLKTMLHKVMFI